LFLACLRDLQSHKLLTEIDREKLFSNITEILDSNVMFWRNTLFPLIRDMRQRRRTTCIENMLEGFSSIHDTFQPYFKYCAEQARCQHYCRENMDSEVFTAYLTWCESQKECNRLRLMDILVQPMQRLTKYGLLLKAILKNTDEDVERESLQTMIKMVDEFVINVNASLKHKQDKERLKGIIARIESYDIVETKDDDIEKILKKEKCYTHLDLTRPMLNCPAERKRHLLLEGDLKLKDSGASKLEVHCFLLTDMLLICKPSTKKGGATMRVVRQPYLVDRLVISELQRETPSLAVVYKNEFDMAVAAFILQNNDSKKLKVSSEVERSSDRRRWCRRAGKTASLKLKLCTLKLSR
jgi:pleckstrin domain-containing family G protein 5